MSNRGWSYFLIGILISSFLGGAVRVFFSPQRIRTWVEEIAARKQPKFNFEFETAQLALANGWFPGVAVEFTNLKIKANDQCVTGSTLNIDRLNVPLRLSDLLSRRVKFGTLSASRVDFRYLPPQCPKPIPVPGLKPGPEDESDFVAIVQQFMRTRFYREVENTKKLLHGVWVDQLNYYHLEQVDPLFTLVEVEGTPSPRGASVQFQFGFKAGFALVGTEPFGVLYSQMSLDPELLDIQGRGNLKEGQYRFNIGWKLQAEEILGGAEFTDMPAKNMMALLERWNLFRTQTTDLRNQWFRCRLAFSGKSQNWQNTVVNNENCSFYGELGDIRLQPAQLKLFQGQLFPIQADFKNVQVKPVIAADPVLSQWVIVPGTVSGKFQVHGFDDVSFKGVWSEPILKALEQMKVKAVEVDWRRSPQQTKFTLKKWRFTETPEDITVETDLSRLADSVSLRWKGSVPTVDPNLLTAFRVDGATNLKSEGALLFNDHKLVSVEARVEADDLRVLNYGFEKFDLQVKRPEQKDLNRTRVELDSGKVEVPQPSNLILLRKLQQSLGLSEKMHLSRLRSSFIWDQEGRWVLNAMQFHLIDKDTDLSAELLGRGYGLAIDQALMKLKAKDQKPKSIQIFGTVLEPRLEAQ